MKPAVSIMVPSRKRTATLYKLIESLRRTASRIDNYEVIIRFSADDMVSMSEFITDPRFCTLSDNIRIIFGTPDNGFNSLGKWFSAMSELAIAPWVWGLSDDTWISGNGWDKQFEIIPLIGHAVFPEWDQLGSSVYHKVEGGPFTAVPRNCWKQLGHEQVGEPPDRFLDDLLRLEHGWKSVFLKGITVVHERQDHVLI